MEIRETLRGIYGNLKAQDQYIRFSMLTGVTRFGHLSILVI
ncbi:AAA family ATPase [Muribaculum intestinale]